MPPNMNKKISIWWLPVIILLVAVLWFCNLIFNDSKLAGGERLQRILEQEQGSISVP